MLSSPSLSDYQAWFCYVTNQGRRQEDYLGRFSTSREAYDEIQRHILHKDRVGVYRTEPNLPLVFNGQVWEHP